MTSSTHDSGTLERQAEVFSQQEELALVGFLAGYGGLTLEAYQLDFVSTSGGARSGGSRSSVPAEPTSRSSAAIWRRWAERGRRLHGVCAR
jgi:hypothetical protein